LSSQAVPEWERLDQAACRPPGPPGSGHPHRACPDVILFDLRLPDHSGLDILRQVRRIDARIPIVMVTVARSSDSAIEAMRHGAYDYLLKPICKS